MWHYHPWSPAYAALDSASRRGRLRPSILLRQCNLGPRTMTVLSADHSCQAVCGELESIRRHFAHISQRADDLTTEVSRRTGRAQGSGGQVKVHAGRLHLSKGHAILSTVGHSILQSSQGLNEGQLCRSDGFSTARNFYSAQMYRPCTGSIRSVALSTPLAVSPAHYAALTISTHMTSCLVLWGAFRHSPQLAVIPRAH